MSLAYHSKYGRAVFLLYIAFIMFLVDDSAIFYITMWFEFRSTMKACIAVSIVSLNANCPLLLVFLPRVYVTDLNAVATLFTSE